MANTDIDLSEFDALESQQGPKCGVGQAIKNLSPAKRAKLKSALAQTTDTPGRKRIQSTAIRRWLEREGFELSAHTINNHRRGECRCGN